MKNRKIIGIFAIILIASSLLKLFGVSLHPLVEAYEKVATVIMTWIAPNIFSDAYASSVKTLTIYMPILFSVCLVLGLIQIIKYRRHHKLLAEGKPPVSDSGEGENE